MNKTQRILLLVGNPNQVTTRGGQPYFFLQSAKKLGFIDSGLPLKPEKLRLLRYLWNFWSLITTGQKGGFQYTYVFLNNLIKQVQVDCQDSNLELISYFPLLPPPKWYPNSIINYYIDATLKQNFEDYGLSKIVSKFMQEKALIQEKQNYDRAKRIICRSVWAAQSIVENYGVSSSKVHVILPGASIDEGKIKKVELDKIPPIQPLRLGFIGKDWQRKRLPYLLEIAELLKTRNIEVEVMVIGPTSQELPQSQVMKCLGFINKQEQMETFIKIVQSWHFGCLFSTTEGQGQSILECMRLGVPVLGSKVGGIPDSIPQGLGFTFELDVPAKEVAELLAFFVQSPKEYEQLRHKVIRQANEFSWIKTIERFIQLWQGSQKFLYENIT